MSRCARRYVLLIGVILCAAVASAAQEKVRRVEQPAKYLYKNTPIEVIVKFDDKEMVGRETKAGPDWLQRVSLEVNNISGKDINWLWINLTLREPVLGVNTPSPETAGIVVTVELPFSEPRIKVLPAGGRVVLKPPDSLVEYWTKRAEEQGMKDIERVVLDIKQVGFTNDMTWTRGRWSRKDPATGRSVFIPDNPGTSFSNSPSSIFIPKLFFF